MRFVFFRWESLTSTSTTTHIRVPVPCALCITDSTSFFGEKNVRIFYSPKKNKNKNLNLTSDSSSIAASRLSLVSATPWGNFLASLVFFFSFLFLFLFVFIFHVVVVVRVLFSLLACFLHFLNIYRHSLSFYEQVEKEDKNKVCALQGNHHISTTFSVFLLFPKSNIIFSPFIFSRMVQ